MLVRNENCARRLIALDNFVLAQEDKANQSGRATAGGETHPSATEMVELTILMPCLNEAETLENCIRKAQGFLSQHRIKGEVMVADNGSSDGSQKIATQAGAHLVPVAAIGYGSALIAGIQAAQSKYIIMGDADDSYDFSDLLPLVEKLREGCDLVMGNRFVAGTSPVPCRRFTATLVTRS